MVYGVGRKKILNKNKKKNCHQNHRKKERKRREEKIEGNSTKHRRGGILNLVVYVCGERWENEPK